MNKDYYKTQSLPLAASLQVISLSKLELVEFSPDSNRATFYFDRSKDPQFDDILAQFWARQLMVDAQTYFEAIKQIKNRMYEERNGKGF